MNILLLSFSLQSLSAPDKWFGADKAKHFFIGTFVQSASFGVLRASGVETRPALVAASAATVSVVIAKEIRDRTCNRQGADADAAAKGGRICNGRGTPSVKDVTWGLAGAAAISPVLARTR